MKLELEKKYEKIIPFFEKLRFEILKKLIANIDNK